MRILDLSAGNRGIWFDKNQDDVVFVDIRPEVKPDIVADSRQLPLMGEFDLIIFDPPHINFGARSNMSRNYGHHTTVAIRDIIRGTAKEAHRVAAQRALMIFKWNDHDQSFARVLALMAQWWKPLVGTTTALRTKHVCSTQLIMLQRMAV